MVELLPNRLRLEERLEELPRGVADGFRHYEPLGENRTLDEETQELHHVSECARHGTPWRAGLAEKAARRALEQKPVWREWSLAADAGVQVGQQSEVSEDLDLCRVQDKRGIKRPDGLQCAEERQNAVVERRIRQAFRRRLAEQARDDIRRLDTRQVLPETREGSDHAGIPDAVASGRRGHEDLAFEQGLQVPGPPRGEAPHAGGEQPELPLFSRKHFHDAVFFARGRAMENEGSKTTNARRRHIQQDTTLPFERLPAFDRKHTSTCMLPRHTNLSRNPHKCLP